MKGRAAQGALHTSPSAEVDGHPTSLLISDRTPQASDNHEVLAAVVPAKSDQDDETPPQDGVGEIPSSPNQSTKNQNSGLKTKPEYINAYGSVNQPRRPSARRQNCEKGQNARKLRSAIRPKYGPAAKRSGG